MSAIVLFLFAATIFLAYTNGANDNFKGVATLFGSGTTNYKKALTWATATTFAGSLVAVWLSAELVKNFSGKGLVPDAVALDSAFLASIGSAAAVTVFLATRFGFPISTTHAMTGALIGAGLVATRGEVNWSRLGASFFLPLIVSPLLALALAVMLYPLFRWARRRLGVNEETVIAVVGTKETYGAPVGIALPPKAVPGATFAVSSGLAEMLSLSPGVAVGKEATLIRRYNGAVMGISAQQMLDVFHYFSAGSVSFARGLNDAPKIIALIVAAKAMSIEPGLLLVAIAMALGGILSAKRIAETMSKRITEMNAGQDFTANLVTSILVIGASHFGVPVSTTHVSCGALFGIGAVNRRAKWKMILQILIAWVTTLPIAIACAAIVQCLLKLLVA